MSNAMWFHAILNVVQLHQLSKSRIQDPNNKQSFFAQ